MVSTPIKFKLVFWPDELVESISILIHQLAATKRYLFSYFDKFVY